MSTTALSKLQPADGRAINPRYPIWQHIVPLPPDSLMWSVGGASVEMFLVLGDAWAQLVSRYTRPDCTVLDIGCGCGRTARVLLNNRFITRYIGFDVIRENVEWCQTYIQPAWHGTSEFHHFDLFSGEYNPTATLKASEMRFPADDSSVDVCFASSVFTHLLEPDARHYLREIARVLTPTGTAVLSLHNAVPAGERFVGTELRIDIASDYFVELAAAAGLREAERMDDLGGQQVIMFRRHAPAR
jgi:SAM-dependent methyltransferase